MREKLKNVRRILKQINILNNLRPMDWKSIFPIELKEPISTPPDKYFSKGATWRYVSKPNIGVVTNCFYSQSPELFQMSPVSNFDDVFLDKLLKELNDVYEELRRKLLFIIQTDTIPRKEC